MANSWITALKKWNEKNGGAWCVPKKGTKDYDEVRALMGAKKAPAREKKAPAREKKAPAREKKAPAREKSGNRFTDEEWRIFAEAELTKRGIKTATQRKAEKKEAEKKEAEKKEAEKKKKEAEKKKKAEKKKAQPKKKGAKKGAKKKMRSKARPDIVFVDEDDIVFVDEDEDDLKELEGEMKDLIKTIKTKSFYKIHGTNIPPVFQRVVKDYLIAIDKAGISPGNSLIMDYNNAMAELGKKKLREQGFDKFIDFI